MATASYTKIKVHGTMVTMGTEALDIIRVLLQTVDRHDRLYYLHYTVLGNRKEA